MRYLRYFLAALLILALAAGIALHLKREAVALKIANDVLAGSGFVVSDLSIARLRADEIRFSRLILEQADGARYTFHDLFVPLELPSTTVRSASIGRVEVQPAPGNGSPARYAELLDLALSLPGRFPGTSVTAGRVDWPGWPSIENLAWQTGTTSQQLDLVIGGLPLQAKTDEMPAGHRLDVETRRAVDVPPLQATLDLLQANPGYRATGRLHFSLEPWLEIAHATGLAAVAGLEARGTGTATLDAGIETARPDVPLDALPGTLQVALDVVLDDGSEFSWSMDMLTARVNALRSATIAVALPLDEWSLRTGEFTLALTQPYAERMDASVTSVACSAGECRVAGSVRVGNATFDAVELGSLEAGGEATLRIPDDGVAGWHLSAAIAAFTASSIRGADWQAGRLRIADAAGLIVNASAEDIGIAAKHLSLDVEDLRAAGGLSGNLRARLDTLAASPQPLTLRARFDLPKERLDLAWENERIVPARLEGHLEFADPRGKARVSVTDPARELAAIFDVDIHPQRIGATISNATIGFGAAPLSESLPEWQRPWDIVAGTGSLSGTVAWVDGAAGGALAAELDVRLRNGAAAWEDLGATGIDVTLPIRLTPGNEPVVGPAEVAAALVDVGLPLKELATEFEWDLAQPDVHVASLRMGLFGGTLAAAPFDFDVDAMQGLLELEVDAVQLGLIPELANFESVELTGALSGRIPLSIDGGTVTVKNGRLENDPPGGTIRYRTEGAPSSNPGLALAQRALSNLQYESLSSDVSYSKEGDLVMNLRLKGTNPDLDPLQPVILNLSVENNIPDLLQSLQATRDIQDVIESRTRKNPGKLSQ